MEAQARRALVEDGCPPCYPPNLEIPLRPPFPAECQAILDYWLSFPGTGDVPLCAQWTAWQKFRASQKRTRQRFKPFSTFVDRVRERRRKHGLDCDVRMTAELERQGQLERWIEFQDYQLRHLEKLVKDRDSLEEELSGVGNVGKAAVADATANDDRDVDDNVTIISQLLETADRDLRRHRILLQWVEQKRQEICQGLCPTTGEGLDHSDAARSAQSRSLRTTSRRGRGSRSLPTVLGKNARVSKPSTPLQGRRTRSQGTGKAPPPEPAIDQNADAISHNNISNTSRPRVLKRREAGRAKKGNSLRRQLQPQRVAKRETRATPVKTVLKSGRVSRPPDRWIP
ncbi:hypothetical protein F5883DRAFT_592737 [Diaporthe sp. PMI_573]|nr:hypothetical protein F5883DRAFT_592737 [Diaporthaceae sp. PMI_573]